MPEAVTAVPVALVVLRMGDGGMCQSTFER